MPEPILDEVAAAVKAAIERTTGYVLKIDTTSDNTVTFRVTQPQTEFNWHEEQQ